MYWEYLLLAWVWGFIIRGRGVMMIIRDNRDHIKVLLYSFLYHYYRVEGP